MMTSTTSMASSVQHRHQCPSQLKLLQVLENCKQLPKDDRLALRKMVKQGDSLLIAILSDPSNKKLQVHLRKHLQNAKDNARGQHRHEGRLNTIVDMKIVSRENRDNREVMGTPVMGKSKCRSATHSLQKNISMCNLSSKKSIDASHKYKGIKDSKENRENRNKNSIRDIRDQLNSMQCLRSNSLGRASTGSDTRAKVRVAPPHADSTSMAAPLATNNTMTTNTTNTTNSHNNGNKYGLQDSYLRESNATYINTLLSPSNGNPLHANSKPATTAFNYGNGNGLYTSPDLLNWQPPHTSIYHNLTIPASIPNNTTHQNRSGTNSMANSRSLQSSAITKSLLHESFEISPSNPSYNPYSICPTNTTTNCFIKSSIPSLAHQQQDTAQKSLYNFKCALINHYAQDIFDYIVHKYFASTIVEKSVYLPYRQLLKQVQTYLQSKGEHTDIIKDDDIKVPLLQPFSNEYEGVSLKNLGLLLNKLCLHRNSSMRGIFIVLGVAENEAVSVEKFNKINSWKGQELVQAFQRLVSKHGQNNSISYWQAYRCRKQKQYLLFDSLYSKL